MVREARRVEMIRYWVIVFLTATALAVPIDCITRRRGQFTHQLVRFLTSGRIKTECYTRRVRNSGRNAAPKLNVIRAPKPSPKIIPNDPDCRRKKGGILAASYRLIATGRIYEPCFIQRRPAVVIPTPTPSPSPRHKLGKVNVHFSCYFCVLYGVRCPRICRK